MTSLNPSHNPFSSSAQAVHHSAPKESTKESSDEKSTFPDTLPTISGSRERDQRKAQRRKDGKEGRTQARKEARERVRGAMPPMPDLRFEQSFLLSIRPFLTPRPTRKTINEKGPVEASGGRASANSNEKESKTLVTGAEEDEVFHWGRQVDVDWAQVGWITFRDQMFSPLVQGALWGFATVFLAASGAVLRGALYPSSHVRQGRIAGGPGGEIKSTSSASSGAGNGGDLVGETGWWKKWVGSWFGAVETAVV